MLRLVVQAAVCWSRRRPATSSRWSDREYRAGAGCRPEPQLVSMAPTRYSKVDSGLGAFPSTITLPQPLQIRVLHFCPGLYAVDHRFAHRTPQAPISLRVLSEGVHHLLIAVQP